MDTATEIFRKHRHLIAVITGVIVVFVLIYLLRNVLLPFLIGFAVVHLMEPVVHWVERRFPHTGRWSQRLEGKRVLSILLVNTVIILVFGILGFYIFSTIVHAFSILLSDAAHHWAQAVATLQQLTGSARELVPSEMREHLDEFAVNAGKTLTEALQANFKDRLVQLPATISMMLGLAVLPLFVFYILKDHQKLSKSFYSSLPEWAADNIKSIFMIIDNILGQYIRATMVLGAAVGSLTLIGLLIIGAPLAPMLAVVAGVTEMIPTLGPWIGGLIATVVTLALAPEKTVFVIILAITVQLLENSLLVPRIQSGFLGLHPVVTIVLLVVGGALAGVWGLLLIIPMTATMVQIFHYVLQVVREEDSVLLKDRIASDELNVLQNIERK
ncbi:MAG: AI-2E family transporter [Chloroflexi bacterium]|nr:AI-2E family transporter [Chloroflexota bacterium]